MKKSKKHLSILLSVLMIFVGMSTAALAAAPGEEAGYSVFIYYNGLSNDSVSYASANHELLEEPYYVIPENPDTVKEGLTFLGFFSKDTKKMYQIGESVPLEDFTLKGEDYYLYLDAKFSEAEKPGVTYTDIDRYYVNVNVVYPDDPQGYLEDPDYILYTYGDVFEEELQGENAGTASQLRQFTAYIRMGLSFIGYRSLLTGTVFENGDTFDVDKLPDVEYVGQELEEISDTEGYRVSVYEVNDYVEPLFQYLGAVGSFIEPLYECSVNYYIPVDFDEEETTDEPLQFFACAGTDVYTMAMCDIDLPMELTCQPEYMEDLGYVFDGYGALTDDEITYPDGLIFMDQFSANYNEGHLSYAVKLFYSEADEDATEEELLASAKEKISAKYQDILEDETASEGMKAVAADILAAIADAADRNEMKDICREGEEKIRLQCAKDEAIAEIINLLPEGDISEEMQAIVNMATADIQACEDTEDFETIISNARYEINLLIEKEINFAYSKEEAVEQIKALADENSSDKIKAIVEKAAEAATEAKNDDELSDIILNAQADIAAQVLAEAKEAAKADIKAICGEDPSEAVKAIFDEFCGRIESANKDEIDSIREEYKTLILAQIDSENADNGFCTHPVSGICSTFNKYSDVPLFGAIIGLFHQIVHFFHEFF